METTEPRATIVCSDWCGFGVDLVIAGLGLQATLPVL